MALDLLACTDPGRAGRARRRGHGRADGAAFTADLAERAGVPAEVCDAVAEGRRAALGPAHGGPYDVVAELLAQGAVGDVSYASAVTRLREQGVVELVALAGYYTTAA